MRCPTALRYSPAGAGSAGRDSGRKKNIERFSIKQKGEGENISRRRAKFKILFNEAIEREK
jgi:hypothetical protein